MSSKQATRHALSLKEKYEVINTANKNPGLTSRALATKFSCSKTQINTVLKNKDSIVEMYEANMSSTSVLSRKRSRPSEFSAVNEALYSWYLLATSRNIYPGGPQLCEKAKQIAEQLGVHEFKGSNGWLSRWKTRYNVKRMRVCGESGEVSGETVDSWKERLPELLEGYSSKTYTILTRLDVFGVHCPKLDLELRALSAMVGKRQSRDLLLPW